MARHRTTTDPPIHPRWSATLTLADGRTLALGDEFTVQGEGRFVFRYGWNGNEATCYGPINNPQQAMVRTFHAARITRIHRKKNERG